MLIFEIDPRNHLSHAKFMEVSELLEFDPFFFLMCHCSAAFYLNTQKVWKDGVY